MYVFGSVACGAAEPRSSVDLGILFRQPPTSTLQSQPLETAADLERHLGAPTTVVLRNSASPELRIRVLRHGLLVVEHDRPARIRFEVATRSEYSDLEPILIDYRRARRTA